MGDHATNIAEVVYYIAEGRTLHDERPKVDTTRIIGVPPTAGAVEWFKGMGSEHETRQASVQQ